MYDLVSNVEKKTLFRHGLMIGTGIILLIAIQNVSVIFATCVMALINHTSFVESIREVSNLMYNDTIIGYLIQTLINSLSFIVSGFFIIKSLKYNFNDAIKTGKNDYKGYSLYMVLFVMGASMLANVVVSFTNAFFTSIFGKTPTTTEIGDGNYNSLFVAFFVFINVAIVPPLIEEFFFRGAILGVLRKYGDGLAIVISALLFALIHGNFVQIPFAFIVGLALGYITVISESIWPAIIAHSFNNAFSFISGLIPNIVSTILLFLLILVGVVCFFYLITKEIFRKTEKVPSTLSSLNKFVRLFFSPTIIVCVIYFLFSAVVNM